jgi:hypothetical protein
MGRLRRWGMLLLLCVLLSVIAGYLVVTDPQRVRTMAESYLTAVIGGRVEVDAATLSIFEGVRLEGVRVFVEEGDEESVLFSADSFLIKYSPRRLLIGRLEATQIVAIQPHIHLTENLDTGTWNFERLAKHHRDDLPSATRFGMRRELKLPEILLRNAQVGYREIRNGQSVPLGWMGFEGRLWPEPNTRRYNFRLQSRGAVDGPGASARGWLVRDEGEIRAQLSDFVFGRDILSMLPAEVRRWCEQHELKGQLNIPEMSYLLPREGRLGRFRVVTMLEGVELAVHAREWMSREQQDRWQALQEAMQWMQRLGPHPDPTVAQVARLLELEALRLEDVDGWFVFTEEGIHVQDLRWQVDANQFRATGRIEGYSPDAALALTVSTPNITIPASPRYIDSMPGPVREIYEMLRPEGIARVRLQLGRPSPGGKVEVNGEIRVVDGSFVFDEFPYPVRNATGRIVLRSDPERVELHNLRGRGVIGGPNADSVVTVNGWVGPFAPGTGIGMQIRVVGDEIASEPALIAAFPEEVKEALGIFGAPLDAEQRGLLTRGETGGGSELLDWGYPEFRGGFVCEVLRDIGREAQLAVNVDIRLDEASGVLRAFTYPLEGVSGEVRIRKDRVEIINARMKRGDATLAVDGRVDFGDDRPVTPDVRVRASGVPVDEALLGAMPVDRREWLERLGVGGVIDLEGRVFLDIERSGSGGQETRTPRDGAVGGWDGEIGYAFDIHVRDGWLRPRGTAAGELMGEPLAGGAGDDEVVSGVTGMLRLTDGGLTLMGLAGRRGEGTIRADGEIGWGGGGEPTVTLGIAGEDVLLDEGVYALLPEAGQQAWEQVQPEGTIDFELVYGDGGTRVAGAMGAPLPRAGGVVMEGGEVVESEGGGEPVEGMPVGLELTIRPRKLSATVKAVPYRLDELSGSLRILPDRVLLNDISGAHGEGTVSFSGTGTFGATQVWDLQLSGDNVEVDEALLTAMPQAIGEMMRSLKVSGRISFEFPRFVYREIARVGDSTEARAAEAAVGRGRTGLSQALPEREGDAAGLEDGNYDVDFVTVLRTDSAALEAGVELSEVAGMVELAGSVRGGRLSELEGRIDVPSLRLSGRPAANFRANLLKQAELPLLQMEQMQADVAGGDMAGQVLLAFPEQGPSRYVLNLMLRNADLRELSDESDIRGLLSASVALEGSWDDPSSRRGRGDVQVTGRQLYRIPVVLGLLQVTNLSLPLSSPFNEGTARYSVNGGRVNFEQIELRSATMLMQGSGRLDYDTRKVRLTFVTDSPASLKLPFVHGFLQGVRQELLQIHIHGSIEEPKVGARSFNTFTTTVDEVLRGNGR